MAHTHHIIPKHMGGTDELSNKEKITVEVHADRHKKLWEKHGKKEDYSAWKSLSEQIGKEELFKKTSSIGGINNTGKPKSEEHRKKISDSLRGERSPLPEDVKERISDSMIGNANSKNHSSSEYKSKQSNAMKNAWIRRKQKKPV
jgi:hypothetical protein